MAADDRGPAARGVVANVVYGFAAQLTTAVFSAVLLLYLLRALGPEDYGVFALAMSIGAMAILVSDAGLAQSAARFLAEQRTDLAALQDITATALRLKIAAGLGTAILLVLAAAPIAEAFDASALKWALRAMALSLFFESLLMLYTSAFAAIRQVQLSVRVIAMESAMEMTASIVLVALGGGVAGAMFGRAAGYAVGAIAGAVVLARVIGRGSLSPRRGNPELRSKIARYALPLAVTNSAYTLFSSIDALLIGAILSTTAVAFFSAPMKLITLFSYLSVSVASAVAPRLAREKGAEPDSRLFNLALGRLALLQIFVCVPLLVWAEPLVNRLLGADYAEAADVLRALTPYIFLRGVSPLITVTTNYLGAAGRRIPIILTALVVNAAIDIALLEELGVVAAAIGTGVAYGIYVPAHLRICRQHFPIPLAPLAVVVGKGLLAGAAMAGVLLAFGTGADVAIWKLVAGGILATAAFVAGLFVTRAVRPDDLRPVLARIRQR